MTTILPFRPGLWLVEVSLDEYGVRGAVIAGDERILIWDTLSHPRDMAAVVDLLEREGLADRPLIVAYSHADWDHIWGTGGLPAGVPVVAHASCRARFEADVPRELAAYRRKSPGRWDDVTLVPPTILFEGRVAIDLGGVTVELSHLPGHTDDSSVAFLPAWRILLPGDTVETPLPLLGEALPLRPWIDRLSYWADRSDVETVIPCHGRIGGRDLLEANVAYLEGLCDGTPMPKAGGDDPFYQAGHEANVRRAVEQQDG